MQPRRVAVLGGGPGGLYAARLLKLAYPACEVQVHEQGEPDATFGFGVGLASGTQRNLESADPDTLRELVATGVRHDMTMQVRGQRVRVRNDRLIGVARTELLAVLQRHAEKAGVQLEFGVRPSSAELDADLVVAADGVSSATREEGSFGAHVETGEGLYLWCGADFSLPDAVFAPVETEYGTFVAHAYPYSGGRSTFLIETDERTWRNAGFDRTTVALEGAPPSASDEESLRYLEKIFAGQLRRHRLIGNRTRWLRFRTVRCERWSDGNVVLLGDAAHTAHFSIGSGTKLAMEDAIGLVAVLRDSPDLATAFARYEALRRPAVERLQELARRSQLWWESFPSRLDLPVERLMVAYMSRAGNVSLDRFAGSSPDAVGVALRQYGGTQPHGDLVQWVLDRPLTHGGRTFPDRVTVPELKRVHADLRNPWSPEADALVARGRGSGGVLVTGPAARSDVLTRLDLAERIRLETGELTAVEGPAALREDLAAGLVSGRTDLVSLTEEQV
ncbi:FAD-dependent monooxygenase [Amycolatopsis panacis]|uniref:Oxidoreductase n=1 Tax=Amycolatopsis panacis TaxID=2340917 RepID=A0A419I4U3_9PSEU|nr:FAD-dependent monooxygenase [Amycolatopsis panacis]RJQ85553.1 oxidoreductase [Amycolatopsis panacis]